MVEKYREEYITLHEESQSYGASGVAYLNEASIFINYLQAQSVLDFGCGKGTLIDALKSLYGASIDLCGYDPYVKGKDLIPNKKYDPILCTDVLEHIPEEEIEGVLDQIKIYGSNVFFVLDHSKAFTVLPNGENAHCTIKPLEWYLRLFEKKFKKLTYLESADKWRSVVLTFGITPDVYNQYYKFCVDKRQ